MRWLIICGAVAILGLGPIAGNTVPSTHAGHHGHRWTAVYARMRDGTYPSPDGRYVLIISDVRGEQFKEGQARLMPVRYPSLSLLGGTNPGPYMGRYGCPATTIGCCSPVGATPDMECSLFGRAAVLLDHYIIASRSRWTTHLT